MDHCIGVVLVDDHPGFRKALRRLLSTDPDLRVVAEAGDGVAGIQAVEEHRPDAVVMDIQMPAMGGIEATKVISNRFPEVRVIVLSMEKDDYFAALSCEAGACHYLCKDCSPGEIIAAIKNGKNCKVD